MAATRDNDQRSLLHRLREDADDVANAIDAGLADGAAAAIARIQAGLTEAERNASKNGAVPLAVVPQPNGATPEPAQAEEAEAAVLGSCMMAAGAIKAAAREVRVEHFYSDSHRLIFEAILTLDEAGLAADAITVTAHLEERNLLKRVNGVGGGPGGKARVYELASAVPASANVAHYARIVRRVALERRLVSAVAGGAQNTEAISEAAAALTRERLVGDPRRAVDGADWLRNQPEGCPAVWGRGDQVLWAEGEPLMIYGPDGVGKTSLAQQVVLHRCGIRLEAFLNIPVARAEKPVLYLSCDRPRQARRSLYRMIPKDRHGELEGRLLVWEGPLPFSIPASTRSLLEFCLLHDAGTVVIDSLKDVAVELTNPEVALKVNQAFQWLNANGVELLILHHPRKDPAGAPQRPRSLEDVYGDRNFVAGMGSVVCLWGKGGDPIVDLTHLKQPMSEVGPFKVLHDHDRGSSGLYEFVSIAEMLGRSPRPLSVVEVASMFFGSEDPSKNEMEKVRRKLRELVGEGLAVEFKDSDTGALAFAGK
jgi:replicative DNA helicase